MKKRIITIHIFVFVSVAFIHGCYSLAPRGIISTELRYDGIYQSEKENEYWYYVRYYEDGTLIFVCTTGTPTQVLKWFRKDNEAYSRLSIGNYKVRGDKLVFNSTSSLGTVYYDGIIKGDTLILDTKSDINEYRSRRIFRFIKFSEE